MTVSGLTVNQDATCTFKNRLIPAELTVVKVFEGTPVQVGLLVDNEVRKTGSTQTFSTGPLASARGHHQVSELFSNPDFAALYESSYVCVSGTTRSRRVRGRSSTGGVEAVAGAPVTCTFTNRKDLTGQIAKSAFPPVVPEPEAQVRFRITVVNTSRGPATIRSLRDDVYGNLDANSPASEHSWISSACITGQTLEAFDGTPGGADTYRCPFTGRVVGSPPKPHTDTATVTLEDATGDTTTSSGRRTVGFLDVPPSIDVVKSLRPDVRAGQRPGRLHGRRHEHVQGGRGARSTAWTTRSTATSSPGRTRRPARTPATPSRCRSRSRSARACAARSG